MRIKLQEEDYAHFANQSSLSLRMVPHLSAYQSVLGRLRRLPRTGIDRMSTHLSLLHLDIP